MHQLIIFNTIFKILINMYKENHDEIKIITGKEMKEILCDLNNIYDLGTQSILNEYYLEV